MTTNMKTTIAALAATVAFGGAAQAAIYPAPAGSTGAIVETEALNVGDQILLPDVGQTALVLEASDTREEVLVVFRAAEALRINGFAIGGAGRSGGADLGNSSYELITGGTITRGAEGSEISGGTRITNAFADDGIRTNGNNASAAGGFGDLLNLMAGEEFVIRIFESGPGDNANNLGFTVSFDAEAPAAVPLPAAGGMLLASVAMAGFVARRRKNG